jgi:hypothetical protein
MERPIRPGRQRTLALATALLSALSLLLVAGPRLLRGHPWAHRLWRRLTTEERCASGPGAVRLCVASDMARLPLSGPVPLERWLFDPGRARVRLHAARNETVAFQLILRGDPRRRSCRGSGRLPRQGSQPQSPASPSLISHNLRLSSGSLGPTPGRRRLPNL